METYQVVIIAAVSAALGFSVVKLLDKLRRRDAEEEGRKIVEKAEQDGVNKRKEAEFQAKEILLQQRAAGEQEQAKLRKELHERERVLDKRQDTLDQQTEQLKKQEKMVETTQRRLTERIEESNKRNEQLGSLIEQQKATLFQLSGMSKENAEKRLLDILDQELSAEQGQRIQKFERHIAEICDVKAKDMLITSIQRYAASHTAETTTSTVDIPSDEMKGRIIGREGRNIRAFEKATGVDVIIDDTPGVVIVSGFDPVRREIARMSLNKLIADGRIHPSRIEELVAETTKEMDGHILKHGEEAAAEVGIGRVNPKVIQLLGRLRFRTSYSQNVLRHSIEVAFIAGLIAEEVGLDGDLGASLRSAARHR
ncbi:MAG: Rnase Y domain-containing protein [Pirellulales bacterium]